MSECFITRNNVTSSATEQGQQSKMPKTCVSLMDDKQDLLTPNESTGCQMGIVCRKVVDAKSDMKKAVARLRRGAFCSYASIRQNVVELLLSLGSRLKKMFDCEAKGLQQDVHDALRVAVGGVQKTFADASEVVC